ncbi:hypothetical protein MRB53_031138 [Persea americana]|uniref:Uncharacterized protein n=1 Tax=Persea americana TaxID=3435 RepID=A0ACC2KN69_PERAE|nr:hypothetical protein MRB53_031138 [Persea americana]
MEGEEAEEEIMDPSSPMCELLVAAFLAMEPTDCLISLAKECGGGSITKGVQRFVWDQCVNNVVGRNSVLNHSYIKNFLKKLIVTAESSGRDVLDGLYEQYACYMTSFKDDGLLKSNTRVCKSISFLFPNGHPGDWSSRPMKLVVPLQCSVNMLKGDTGCSIWPSSLFLSEYILSYPEIFSNKSCFEVGSGVGLVGISLSFVNASKVILSDGDLSTLGNMKSNLELNQLNAETLMPQKAFYNLNLIECKYLPWESASEELLGIKPDIVLGADVIYDPSCVPHLVRVLAILLTPNEFRHHQVNGRCCDGMMENFDNDRINDAYGEKSNPQELKASNENGHGQGTLQDDASSSGASNGGSQKKQGTVAYLATVIRNLNTFNCFLRLAEEAHLSVVDLTETKQPLNLLPYMRSYDRSSIRLFAVSFSCN